MHQEHLEKERLDAIVKMSGAVCHEMSQPVQALSGYMDLIKMDPAKYATANQITEMAKQIDRIHMLLDKLSRIRHYKTKLYLKEEIVDIDASSKSETIIG